MKQKKINELEDSSVESIELEQQKEKKKVKKSKDNSKDLWNNIKWTKIHITWFPE